MEDKDIFEAEWDQASSPENEINRIQKAIRKRNMKIVAISVVLAAALLLTCVYGIIPLIESFYWDPSVKSLATNTNDLDITLHAYTELFIPGWEVNHVWGEPADGLAAYDLSITMQNVQTREYFYLDGKLVRNELTLDHKFYERNLDWAIFGQGSGQTDDHRKAHMASTRETLESLPEYISVKAAIAFPQDLTMAQLSEFYYAHHPKTAEDPVEIQWVGIRNEPVGDNFRRMCGMNPFMEGFIFFGLDENYPNFTCSNYMRDPSNLEEHFTSILQYSSDQFEQGTGIPVYWDQNYYRQVLDYVEENGIMTYGCYVITSPQMLLSLLDEGTISYVTLQDAWINIE